MTTRSSARAWRACWPVRTSRSSREAANGKDAVQLAEKHKPDVVLLDIRMPDGDGLATLEKLRAKVPDSQGRHAVDLRQPDLHRPGRGAGGQRLRAQGLLAREI